uniref:F-box protein 15 n=1 Tax=Leptobrachium leishanense TaxID=445787 RepID=A0A8C5M8R7_9ANUR
MATGRGLIVRQHIVQQRRPIPGPTHEMEFPSVSPKVFSQTSQQPKPLLKKLQAPNPLTQTSQDKKGRTTNVAKKHSCKRSSYIEGLPSEIILKIFSYLDVSSLLCIGSANRRFSQISKDNSLWCRVYSSSNYLKHTCWKPKAVQLVTEDLSVCTLQEKPAGYWKSSYMNKILESRASRISQILKSVKYIMGIPANIENAVRMAGLCWVISFTDTSGSEQFIEQMETLFTHSSLTLTWGCLQWPSLKSVTKLKLQGITPMCLKTFMLTAKPGPQKRSLIAEYDLMDLQSSKSIGHDRHVNLLHLRPGLLLGVWQKDKEIAFVMATIHFHQILERSTLGFSDRPYTIPIHTPLLDDLDPNYGLHGYQLHIDMHNGLRTYFCGTFRNLFCKKEYIRNGYLRLSAIGINDRMKHAPLVGKVGLAWNNITFQGNIQTCFLMDVTVLDEAEKPFWCISSPVNLQASHSSESVCDFMGQSFFLNYMDQEGKVKAELLWMNETEEYYIVNLVLYLSTQKVNSWFGTKY